MHPFMTYCALRSLCSKKSSHTNSQRQSALVQRCGQSVALTHHDVFMRTHIVVVTHSLTTPWRCLWFIWAAMSECIASSPLWVCALWTRSANLTHTKQTHADSPKKNGQFGATIYAMRRWCRRSTWCRGHLGKCFLENIEFATVGRQLVRFGRQCYMRVLLCNSSCGEHTYNSTKKEAKHKLFYEGTRKLNTTLKDCF